MKCTDAQLALSAVLRECCVNENVDKLIKAHVLLFCRNLSFKGMKTYVSEHSKPDETFTIMNVVCWGRSVFFFI